MLVCRKAGSTPEEKYPRGILHWQSSPLRFMGVGGKIKVSLYATISSYRNDTSQYVIAELAKSPLRLIAPDVPPLL